MQVTNKSSHNGLAETVNCERLVSRRCRTAQGNLTDATAINVRKSLSPNTIDKESALLSSYICTVKKAKHHASGSDYKIVKNNLAEWSLEQEREFASGEPKRMRTSPLL